MKKKLSGSTFLFASLFGLLLLYVFLPLCVNSGSKTVGGTDTILMGWILERVQTLLLQHKSIFTLPYFAPYQNTLTYSEPLLSSAVVLLPLRLFTLNLIQIQNWGLLLTTLCTATGIYLFVRKWLNAADLGILAAFLFTFHEWHFRFIWHIHTYVLVGIPWACWAILTYSKTRQLRYWWLFVASIMFQLGHSVTSSLLFCVLLFCWFCTSEVFRRTILQKRVMTLLSVVLVIGFSVWLYLPYRQVSQEFGVVRTLRENAHNSRSFEEWITPEFGWTILVAMIIFYLVKNTIVKKKETNILPVKTTIVWSIVGILFMLGPVVKVHGQTVKLFGQAIPLPFAAAYTLIPGFNAQRSPDRWSNLALFGAVLGLCWVISHFLTPSKQKLFIAFLLISFTAILFIDKSVPLKLQQVNSKVPPIYSALPANRTGSLLEIPAYYWPFPGVEHESQRLIFQTSYNMPLWNGSSGLMSPQRKIEQDQLFEQGLTSNILQNLQKEGVKAIIIHKNEVNDLFDSGFIYNDTQTRSVPLTTYEAQTSTFSALKKITCDQNDCLYVFSDL